MSKQQKKPCYEISYIKVPYGNNGKLTVTVKLVNKANTKR